jgi:anti-sigma factor RsiW
MKQDTNHDALDRDGMNLDGLKCREAQPLIGAYLDGELSEPRAALLRKHLLECVACRGGVQDGKQLQRWFDALREASLVRGSEFAAPVPAGFSARVARRAFAGDDGEHRNELQAASRLQEGRVLRFVTRLTALAAAAALLLAAAYRAQSRPSGDRLSADDRAPLSVQEIHDRLDRLNRADGTSRDGASLERTADPRSRGRKRAEERSGD